MSESEVKQDTIQQGESANTPVPADVSEAGSKSVNDRPGVGDALAKSFEVHPWNADKIHGVMDEIASSSKGIKPYVVICQPRRDLREIPIQKLDGVIGIHIDLCGYSHAFGNVGGEQVDLARNILIEEALQSGAKYMLFIGEDTALPWDGFDILHKTAEANPGSMVVGVYYMKLSLPMIHILKGDWITPGDPTPGQVYEIAQSGLDAALIPIELLQKMKDSDPTIPFCCIGVNGTSWKPEDPTITPERIPFIGEDNFFYHRWNKMGFKVLVNTDCQCLHVDLASGKYTAHPSVDLKKFVTNIPLNGQLTFADRERIEKRYGRPLMTKEQFEAAGNRVTDHVPEGMQFVENPETGEFELQPIIKEFVPAMADSSQPQS